MNMNLKLNFKLNPRQILAKLSQVLPIIFGVALIAVFGYTAWLINGALNLKPSELTNSAPAAIKFDQATIKYVQSLKAVSGQTGVTAVGKPNPFGN